MYKDILTSDDCRCNIYCIYVHLTIDVITYAYNAVYLFSKCQAPSTGLFPRSRDTHQQDPKPLFCTCNYALMDISVDACISRSDSCHIMHDH